MFSFSALSTTVYPSETTFSTAEFLANQCSVLVGHADELCGTFARIHNCFIVLLIFQITAIVFNIHSIIAMLWIINKDVY